MAYEVEQDRLRAMLPEGYESLRPVLRINAEVRGGNQCHVELNTAVRHDGKRGWLNIAHWQSPDDDIHFKHDGATTCFVAPFLRIAFTHTGIAGGCPAEHDNDGCFFLTPEVNFEKREASGKYVCSICGYVYDPAEHDGIPFEDLPDDWRCPRCRQPKDKFNVA